MDINENGSELIEESNNNFHKITKEVKNLPKIELQIHPPVSYKISSQKLGPLSLEITIENKETLGTLLFRLYNGNNKGWRELFDIQKKKCALPFGPSLTERPYHQQTSLKHP